MHKIIKLVTLSMCIFLISCGTQKQATEQTKIPQTPIKTSTECASDSDCMAGGCSGQICSSNEKVKGIITTYEWKEEYGCLRLTQYGCVNNTCQWEENDKYKGCINKLDIKNI